MTLADFPRALVDAARPLSYQERKGVLCTYPGCKRQPWDESLQCRKHTLAHRKRQRRANKNRRRKWARKQRCLRCGGKRAPDRRHCFDCLVETGELAKKQHADFYEYKSSGTRTAVETDGYARERYRGQGKRGRQSAAAIDDQDLGYALDAIGKAKLALAAIAHPDFAQLTRSQKIDATGAALAQAEHGVRFVEEVLDRHKYEPELAISAKKIRR